VNVAVYDPGEIKQPPASVIVTLNDDVLSCSIVEFLFVYLAEIDWPASKVNLHELPLGAVIVNIQGVVTLIVPSHDPFSASLLTCKNQGLFESGTQLM
jgi:hypothetical protein